MPKREEFKCRTAYGIVFGQPERKDNRRQIFRNPRTGKLIIAKSKASLAYVDTFINQIQPINRALFSVPVEVTLIMYYRNNRSDLSPELIFDCLQKAGVIKNDNLIVKCTMEKRIDKNNPRVAWCVKEAER